MPIPEEILSVNRPKNSIVIAYGKDKNRYAVRKRVGCKNINGRHVPVNGPTIGHIINGEYVPIESELPCVSKSAVDLRDWANYTLCNSQFSDVMKELLQHYNYQDALKIYCISIIKVCYPGTKDYEVQYRYEESFLSEMYPGVALSRNTVSILMNDLGKTCSRIIEFMRVRTGKVSQDHCLLIDGVLKTNDSKVNTLSNFSRKARVKGEREISVLFAFDLNLMEPVCSKCFPWNMIDARAYENFISENGITKGLIVADKGFPANASEKEFSTNPELHYLNPIKRNSKFIQTHNMLDFEALLPGEEGITYKKAKCTGVNKWLYAFRDSSKAAK